MKQQLEKKKKGELRGLQATHQIYIFCELNYQLQCRVLYEYI